MSEINLPPFYVGQKVVCLETFKRFDMDKGVKCPKKGNKLTVRTIEMCPTYRMWMVRLFEIVNPSFDYREGFIECRFNASKFRAIQENFQSITLEKVLEKETPLISVN